MNDSANASQQFAEMRDGTRIAYTRHKHANSTHRIVLIHSLAMDHTFWEPVVARLTDDASVLVYDCRGHGASDKPAGPYTVELFAQDLNDLLSHIGWATAAVAGASMGGCITLAFAADYPRRAAALGLIDTTAWYGAQAPQLWAERADKALVEGLSSLVAFQTTRWFSDGFRESHPEVVKESVDVFLRNDRAAYAETCRMLGAADKRGALAHIKAPVAVMVGEEDYATPIAMAQAMHDAIPHSTMTILKGGRHLTPLELPDRIADEMKALMKKAKF
jgi:3-oxoadipate enol-lactonase